MKKLLVFLGLTIGFATASYAQQASNPEVAVAQEETAVKKECAGHGDGKKACCKAKKEGAEASTCDKSKHAANGEKGACCKDHKAGEAKDCCKNKTAAAATEGKKACCKGGDKKCDKASAEAKTAN